LKDEAGLPRIAFSVRATKSSSRREEQRPKATKREKSDGPGESRATGFPNLSRTKAENAAPLVADDSGGGPGAMETHQTEEELTVEEGGRGEGGSRELPPLAAAGAGRRGQPRLRAHRVRVFGSTMICIGSRSPPS